MSKGTSSKSIRWIGAAVTAAAVGWVGCSQWQGVEMTESNLVSPNGAITQGADEMRTNWYPDQPGLDPATVAGPNFKQLFKTPLLTTTEKVLAQPIVVNGKVLIVSEENNVYLLDAVTGAKLVTRQLGAPYNASANLGCGDIQPGVGITGTPVVDNATNTAYFFSKSSSGAYTLHAVDAGTLAEKAGFPVTVAGTSQNGGTTKTFDSVHAHQRPGLLLMGGVVYGAFASHCDIGQYVGWIVGISTSGTIKTMYATNNTSGNGDGIWMSGSGLASDGAGRIFFATGNPQGGPAFPATIAGNTPPGNLDESIARLDVSGATPVTKDFFAPFNAQSMGDDDLAGGGVMLLPSQFGTASVPNTAAIVGKAGLFYLLNRDSLGGFKTGSGNGNKVLTEINLNGGTWGHPAAWPGDGGYIAVTTNGGANAQTGYRLQLLKYSVNGTNPSVSVVGYGTSPSGVVNNAGGPPIDNFGAYAGSPTFTSNGTTSGSAVCWAVGGGNLRAYKIQNNMLVSILSKSIGASAKFQTVGIGQGRVYVGTADGNVFGFGAGTAAITGASVAFGTVTVGQNKTMTATITANQNLTIPAGGITVSPSTFTLGAPNPALPATMTSGQTMTIPVTFTPTVAGAVSGSINVTINGGGGGSVSLSGTGQVNAAQLNITPATAAFGGIATGTSKSINLLVQNTGNQALTISGVTQPASPFSVTGLPAFPATIAAGGSLTWTATFAPTAVNTYSSNFVVSSNGGNLTIPFTGSAGTPGHLVITPLSIDFGTTSSGVSVTKSFTVQNTGGTDLQITKSKPPGLGQFVAQTTLGEGSALPAGATLTETVKFTSTTGGTFNDIWVITSDEPGTTATNVAFTGTVSAPLARTGWVPTVSNVSGDVAGNMLDGALGTRWSSGAAMTAGMWVQIDMGTSNSITQVVMDSNGSGDYARAFSVYVSNTAYTGGATTGLTLAGNGTATASPAGASFAAKSGRYIVVVMGTVPAGVTSWWSIHEFNAYGTAGGGGSAPTAPSGLTATAASSSQINLSWTASSTSGVTYSVFRSTTSGFTAGAGNQIASGLTGTTYSSTGLAASTAYYYLVQAVNGAGSSPSSNQATATTQAGGGGGSVLINSGGVAVSPWVADVNFTGGTTINHANTIDLTGVTNPAPAAVYQTGRVGTFSYTIPGFTASSSHTVRLHFCETYFNTTGSRTFNVSINGTQVLTGFDIRAVAGAINKANVQQFTATANASGQIVIQFTTVVNNSLVSGIEIQ
jgi:hypothetical protein